MVKVVLPFLYVSLAGLFNALGAFSLNNRKYDFLGSLNFASSLPLASLFYFALNLFFFRLANKNLNVLLIYLILISVTSLCLWFLSGREYSLKVFFGFVFVVIGNFLVYKN